MMPWMQLHAQGIKGITLRWESEITISALYNGNVQ